MQKTRLGVAICLLDFSGEFMPPAAVHPRAPTVGRFARPSGDYRLRGARAPVRL
jgi:hypothetical protein